MVLIKDVLFQRLFSFRDRQKSHLLWFYTNKPLQRRHVGLNISPSNLSSKHLRDRSKSNNTLFFHFDSKIRCVFFYLDPSILVVFTDCFKNRITNFAVLYDRPHETIFLRIRHSIYLLLSVFYILLGKSNPDNVVFHFHRITGEGSTCRIDTLPRQHVKLPEVGCTGQYAIFEFPINQSKFRMRTNRAIGAYFSSG